MALNAFCYVSIADISLTLRNRVCSLIFFWHFPRPALVPRALHVTARLIYYLRYSLVTLLPLHCVIFSEEGHSTYTHGRNIYMWWQSLGGEKDQYTWDEGWSRPFLKSCRGLGEMPGTARRGQQCQGYFTSRALMSYHWPLSHCGVWGGEWVKWESDVPISPSQMLG